MKTEFFKKEESSFSTRAKITVNGETVLNFCSNNYLSCHRIKLFKLQNSLDTHGFKECHSVRFICRSKHSQNIGKKISEFYGTEDTILAFLLLL
jgi:glycine C-acetyltransferase